MKTVNNFAGLNGFIWWVGEVVNNADSLGIGRCQVRIFGWHADTIPDVELPWAQAVYPLNNPNSFSPPELKEWVLGFFMDGESGQFPMMLGRIPAFFSKTQ